MLNPQVYAGISPCADDMLILNTLISRHKDRRLLASSYLDQIFDLKPLASVSTNNLQRFPDEFATSLSILRNLKFDNLSDFLFLYIALKKLDF